MATNKMLDHTPTAQATRPATIERLRLVVLTVLRRLAEDRCPRVAAALSFTSLLALVPLVTVVFSMLSVFPVFDQWTGKVLDFAYRNFVPALGDVVREYLTSFSAQAGKLTAVGLLTLMLSALLLLATIEDNFNEIWRVHHGRRAFQRLLVYWAVLSLGPLLFAASLSLTSYLLSLPVVSSGTAMAGAGALRFLPSVLEIGGFVLFYMAIPNCTVRLRHALIGGLVATILFELAKRGFVLFVLNFNSYQVIYGALATLPIFLVWIYVSWLVVLVGAHVTAVIPATRPAP